MLIFFRQGPCSLINIHVSCCMGLGLFLWYINILLIHIEGPMVKHHLGVANHAHGWNF